MKMTKKQLYDLYCGLCDLLESCTPQEMDENRDHILMIKNLITTKMTRK